MAGGVFLSIGLCTHNRAGFLPKVLATVAAQTLAPELFELLVIDNHSKDNTREVVEQFAAAHPQLNVRYIYEEKLGVSNARNRAYLEAQSGYVVYLDDDEFARPDWLENYYSFILQNPDAVIYAGKISIHYPDGKPGWITEYVEGWYGKYDFGDQPQVITVQAVASRKLALPNAGNMAVRIDFLKEIGGFDATLGRKGNQLLGGEETKVGMAALELGRAMIYNPHSEIEHVIFPERLSVDFLKEKHFMQGRTFSKLHRNELKNKGVPRLLAGKMVYYAGLAPKLLNRGESLETRLKFHFEQGIWSGLFGKETAHV